MNIIDIIEKGKSYQKLSAEEISYVINAYMKGEIKDYQVSALLMAICMTGMEEDETINLTSAMLHSGDILDLSSIEGIKVDKHSTGGVGDKTTLVVAPLVASCGLTVPKLSGRGLGHTGGTIDKLESIKGFNVSLSSDEFLHQLKNIGVAITTSSLNLAPADKKLYALRDVTGTVSSIPLIAASIMSKKLATNADKIVLDVKVGNGAFMKDKDKALELAKIMIKIGKSFNKETIAIITNMSYPLGNSVGNGLEVREAITTLKGNGDKDFNELCITIASHMVSIGKNIDVKNARNEVINNLINGKAYEKFLEMVKHQNGDINDIEMSDNTISYKAKKTGYITNINALLLGEYVMHMGAGRVTKEDVIDYGVGIVLSHKVGDYIKEGEDLAVLYVRNSDIDTKSLDNVFTIEDNQKEIEPLIYEIVK